jgi:hypothetical protein
VYLTHQLYDDFLYDSKTLKSQESFHKLSIVQLLICSFRMHYHVLLVRFVLSYIYIYISIDDSDYTFLEK